MASYVLAALLKLNYPLKTVLVTSFAFSTVSALCIFKTF